MEKLLSNYDKMVISEKTWEMAKRMLELGDDIGKVVIVTGLTEAEVKEIVKSLMKEAA